MVIRKITGCGEIRRRLAEMGFVVDGAVTLISEMGGNVIVKVRECRVALNKEMASRIMF